MPKLIDHDERRAQIGEALWRIVLRDGVGGVSIREVAAEAGISAGSLRHVFATKDELLLFSMQLVYHRAATRIAGHVEIDDPVEHGVAVLSEVLPFDDERRVEMHVNMALIAESGTRPTLRAEAVRAHDGLRQLCRNVIGRLRDYGLVAERRDVEGEAMRLHALIDGAAMHLVLGDNDPPEAVQRMLTLYLEDLA
ncbi:putative TetR family transcriptional regulator [Gordonia effusa NBRC 100432]|uniref:Putative TetR family transcriptional regulator n=1 Tax=Gordonia effusa NBRC 100432 TaxID=1077974 RepID=H0QW59_9ACTN|nr:TetR family transcriptional regulator C-terminal domain-containing protein [Gordonia effusa]GAB17060.1 putative TetR family transcriptional regulator [Gordonia effusa NBRC 100432]